MIDKEIQIAYKEKKPRRGYQMKGRLMVKCFILAFVFVATAGLVGLGIELIGG